MVEVKFYDSIDDKLLKFAVIISKIMVNGFFVNIEKEILMKSQEGTGKVVKIFYLLQSEN